MSNTSMLACLKCNILFSQYFDAYQHFRYHQAHQEEVHKAIDMFGKFNEQRSVEKMMKVIEVPRRLSEKQQQWFRSVVQKGRMENKIEVPEVAEILADEVVSRLQTLSIESSISQTANNPIEVTVNHINHNDRYTIQTQRINSTGPYHQSRALPANSKPPVTQIVFRVQLVTPLKYVSTSRSRKDYIAMGFDKIYGYRSNIPVNVESFEMLLGHLKISFVDSWDSDGSLELPALRWKEMVANRFTFSIWVGDNIHHIEASKNDGMQRLCQLISSGTLLETVHSVKLGGFIASE